jgi:C-8 sterol isomerase
MIQMKLYHASVNEYLMIWGTPIGSEGHSGRHAVGFWDTVIDGEMWYYGEGQFEKRVYRPGDRVYVGPNQARAMNFTDGVWAVEYARGPLPLSVPFGVADELLSTLDFASAGQTLSIYATLVGRHWQRPPADGSTPSMLRSTLGGLLATGGNALTRLLRPAEPDDTIPSDR